MRYIGIVVLIMVAFSFGCASTVMEGKKIDAAKVNTLALDQPKDQVVAAFGPPLKTEEGMSGETKYIYHYYFKKPHWWTVDEVERQDMEILLKNDRVDSFKYKGIGANDVTLQ
jgi:hypothetical protein